MPATELLYKDNVPFWPCDGGQILRVKEGCVNLYHSQVRDGEPVGPRVFLFQAGEGELVFPLAHTAGTGDTLVGLLVVPMRDTAFAPIEPDRLTAPEYQSAAERWLTSCCERLAMTRLATATLLDGLDAERMRAFNKALMGQLDRQVSKERAQTANANRRRYRGEEARLKNALDRLADVAPRNKEGGGTPDDSGDSPLIRACRAVADAIKMEITIPAAVRAGEEGIDPIGNIAAASHFRTREITLSGKWYRQNGGPLFARLEESGDPVALIQPTPRSYRMINPATGKRVKVTKAVAGQISPKAVMFYRGLPMKSLRAGDLFSFILNGAGRADWVWVFALGLLGGLLGMITPQIAGRLFDTVIPDGDRGMLAQLGFLMGAMALTGFVFELTRAFAMQRISGAAERDLQSAVWDRLLSLPASFFRDYPVGELAQRSMGVSRIHKVLSGAVINALISCFFSVFCIMILFAKSIKLAWIGVTILAVTLLVSLLLSWLQIKHESTLLDLGNDISGKLFGWLSGFAKIKTTGAEKRIFGQWAGRFGRMRERVFRKERLAGGSAVFGSVVPLASAILLYLAMFKLKDARITTGAFIAFTIALQRLLDSCLQISSMVMEINVVIPIYQKVKPIFEALPEYGEQKTDPGELAGEIELSHIHFRYTPDGPPVLKDVSLHIRPGEHVALVGPSGSGKSTLFRILMAFEKPDSGEVYFDGKGLGRLDLRAVRRQLGVVLQSDRLLNGTIFENIAGSNSALSQEDAMRAIRQAGMAEELADMPMGLHTMLSEGMGALSGGQRQRLLIARALASNPKVLLFDEAASALDDKTRKIVSDSIAGLKATRITIAHRLSTLRDCDRIIVLENGVITEEGAYDELMALGGIFADKRVNN